MQETRDAGSISGSGRSLRGGNGNPLQSSCLGNPRQRRTEEPWRVRVHGVAESRTRLSPHIKLPKMRNFKEPHPSILVLQVLCELPKVFKTKSLLLYRASRSTDWLSTPWARDPPSHSSLALAERGPAPLALPQFCCTSRSINPGLEGCSLTQQRLNPPARLENSARPPNKE